MRGLAEEFRASMTLPVLVQGRPVKGSSWRNLSLRVMRYLWQPAVLGGVDVRGDALSCVIIDKLPFTSPDDPLLKPALRIAAYAVVTRLMMCNYRMRLSPSSKGWGV